MPSAMGAREVEAEREREAPKQRRRNVSGRRRRRMTGREGVGWKKAGLSPKRGKVRLPAQILMTGKS